MSEQPCTCVDDLCKKHDAPTPSEDLYAMVDVLRGKLTPTNVCLMCGGAVEAELAFCSVACQNRYTAPNATDWKYTDPEGYYL